MHIYKFGGASVKDEEGVKNLHRIINTHRSSHLTIVVSAMGKTTNNLEALFQNAFVKKDYLQLLKEIKETHRAISKALLGKVSEKYLQLEEELEAELVELPNYEKMRAYDRIIPYGELMSTRIVSDFLNHVENDPCEWVDARTLIRTDQYFTEANVDWVITEKQIKNLLKPIVEKKRVITQGFIGSDVEGNSTTLGREGSDYSGAILAYCLNAEGYTVWKDVNGILNADPRVMDQTHQYKKLSYREVTEMAYYGAKVIHPKTLKPLAQKAIPLMVRTFLDHSVEGTLISNKKTENHLPCFVFIENQLLVTAQVKDHNFMNEKKLGMILQVLDLLNIKINLMQNSALTFSFCIDHKEFKVKRIKELLNRDFLLSFEASLSLATVKNYTEDALKKLPNIQSIIMEQRTSNNYQVLYKQS